MSRKRVEFYGKQDSPFYKLKTKKKLAKLLRTSVGKLKRLSDSEKLYSDFEKEKSGGGVRLISAPHDELKEVQKRIANLLQRIRPPDYLMSPVPGRSYVDNAAYHIGAKSVRQLDIEDFFPNCTANKTIWFFRKQMECSLDVSAILRGIVTRRSSLPQGSPCSPILSYLCYKDMWDEIERLAIKYDCRFSVYVDNLTISGKLVPGKLIWEMKKILRRHGHKHKTEKERSNILKPAEITGVILSDDRLLAPNRQHKRLHEVRKKFKMASSHSQRKKLKAKLTGREAQLNQIIKHIVQ